MVRDPRPDSPDAIGRRLRLIRIAYGMAQGRASEMQQAEFARLAKIGIAAWNNAETGDNRIGIDNAISLRAFTGVGLDYIFLGERSQLPHQLAIEIEKIEKLEKAATLRTPKRA